MQPTPVSGRGWRRTLGCKGPAQRSHSSLKAYSGNRLRQKEELMPKVERILIVGVAELLLAGAAAKTATQ